MFKRSDNASLQSKIDAVKAAAEEDYKRGKKALDRFDELTQLARQQYNASDDGRATRLQEILDEIEAERYFGK